MTEEELRAVLREHDLGRVVDQLMHLAALTIRIYPQRTNEEDIPTGPSKLGGGPDLPDEVSWPAWHEPMAFIAQINLAAVAPYDRERVLPPHGLLSFFYETDGEPLYAERWGLPEDAPYQDDYGLDVSQSWRVLYHAGDPATFHRREIPPGLNEWVRYAAWVMGFSPLPQARPHAPACARRGALAADRRL